MEALAYNYDIRIAPSSTIMSSEPLSEIFVNLGEMILSSKPYYSFEECANAMNKLLTHLGAYESFDGKTYVLLMKYNPKFAADFDVEPEEDPNEVWEKSAVAKSFIADAKILKEESTMAFSIMGFVRINFSHIQAIQQLSTTTVQ